MKIVLKWEDPNYGDNEHRIYKDTSPIDTGALPAALATLGAGVTEYIDYNVVDNTTYYYVVSTVVNAVEYFSDEVEMYAEEDGLDTIQQGVWIVNSAGWGNSTLDSFNSALPNDPNWIDNFRYTLESEILVNNFVYQESGPVDSNVKTGRIDASPVGSSFYITCVNDASTNTIADIDMEFLDANDNVIAVLRFQRDGPYSHGIWYGDDFNNLTKAPQVGTSYSTFGTLTFTSTGFSFTRDLTVSLGNGKNDDFSYSNVNMANVEKINIPYMRAYMDYPTGAGSTTYFTMEKDGGVDPLQNVQFVVDRFAPDLTVTWTEGVPSATLETRLYRSESPIPLNDLPAPLVTQVGRQAVYTMTDPTVVTSTNYYYVLELIMGGRSFFSSEFFAEFNPLKLGLVAHYKIENNTGGLLTDETGNYDATIFGTPTVNTGTGLDGNNTMVFDGQSEHASTGLDGEIDNMYADNNRFWAASGWLKGGQQTAANEDGVVIGRGGGTGLGATFSIFVCGPTGGGDTDAQPANEITLDVRGSYTNSGVDGTDNQWHFVLATWNGNNETGIFRVDGQEFPINRSTLAALQTGNYLAIGSHRGQDSPEDGAPLAGYSYEGQIDNVRVYNKYLDRLARARVEAEFRIVSGLVGNYDFINEETVLEWATADPALIGDVIVYRDTSPIDTGALPPALTTIVGGGDRYVDSTAVKGTTYYYLVDVQTSGPTSNYSESVKVLTSESLLNYESQGTMVWFDASDLNTLFQDTAGTIPVTADGDPVQRWNDKSSNGYDAIIDTGTATYRTDGLRHWIECSLARFKFTQFINGTMDRTFAVLAKPTAWTGNNDQSALMDLYDGTLNTTGGDWTPAIENDGIWIRVSGNNQWNLTTSLNTTYNLYFEWGTSLGTAVADSNVYDQNVALSSLGGSAATINTIASTNSYIGGSLRQVANAFTGEYQQFFLINALLNATERQDIFDTLETYR